jgi:hypothetical protein
MGTKVMVVMTLLKLKAQLIIWNESNLGWIKDTDIKEIKFNWRRGEKQIR